MGLADFMSDFRSNIPNDLYLVADSEYAIGVSDYLVNELGLQPKGIFITDEPPTDAIKEKILGTIETLGKEIKDVVYFESDGGKIQQKLFELIGSSKRAVIFGSTWEKIVAQKNNNMLIHLSMPIVDDVILNKTFTGYTGGLKLTEEIYSGIFKHGTIDKNVQVL